MNSPAVLEIPFAYDIAFVDTDVSPALTTLIETQLAKVSRHYDRITYARVNVRLPHKHEHGARFFHVQIQLDIPGKQIAVSREPETDDAHTDGRVAVRDAFHKLTRQLEDFVKHRSNHHHG